MLAPLKLWLLPENAFALFNLADCAKTELIWLLSEVSALWRAADSLLRLLCSVLSALWRAALSVLRVVLVARSAGSRPPTLAAFTLAMVEPSPLNEVAVRLPLMVWGAL